MMNDDRSFESHEIACAEFVLRQRWFRRQHGEEQDQCRSSLYSYQMKLGRETIRLDPIAFRHLEFPGRSALSSLHATPAGPGRQHAASSGRGRDARPAHHGDCATLSVSLVTTSRRSPTSVTASRPRPGSWQVETGPYKPSTASLKIPTHTSRLLPRHPSFALWRFAQRIPLGKS